MDGTFTGTGTAYVASDPSTYIVGGKGREGQLVLGSGGTGAADLIVSTDGGATWETEGTYDSGDVKHVKFPDPNAYYSLSCSSYTSDFTYNMNSY